MVIRQALALVMVWTASVLSGAAAWAMCPMCRQALEANRAGAIRGFYLSTMLLIAIPIVIFSVILSVYLRLRKRAEQAAR